ncbi:PilZ domain-containing protein [Geopsychrobacter electrodiphilus]|uniref:PilZ domain-containing protein n=1 Tax=Geopsychrobacter electrodiphilus TaxID=225196 RepID=UPI00036814DE|nr:PilZ domain-containing protein [Geopsychrobacter electrodiphilus]
MTYTFPRALERFDIELSALVEILESDQQNIFCYPMTRDLSGDGGYFHTTNPFPEKTRIKIGLIFEINKPEVETEKEHFFLEFTGQVIRAEKTGMAVRFDRNYLHMPINLPVGLNKSNN